MNIGPQVLLVGAVASVGVLHTIVPDHWFPIAVMARQRGWSKSETAKVALKAGTGHVGSTLVIAILVCVAGAAAARRFGNAIDTATSLALVAFGLWIAVSASITQHQHVHPHKHGANSPDHEHDDGGPAPAHGQKGRTALMLIVGSSPMVEGIPAFFAAGKYGLPLIVTMSLVFAVSTILTYVLLCVFSTAGLQRIRFEAFERQGEVLSGVVIALVGLAFWHWPLAEERNEFCVQSSATTPSCLPHGRNYRRDCSVAAVNSSISGAPLEFSWSVGGISLRYGLRSFPYARLDCSFDLGLPAST